MKISTNFELFELCREFVKDALLKAGRHDFMHYERTEYWVKQLSPNASTELRIAAIMHDIERAFNKYALNYKQGFSFENKSFLKHHSEESARIACEFLKEKNASTLLISHVKELIEHHEFGGDGEKDILKDADSISFFELYPQFFKNNLVDKTGVQSIILKFNFMYERISSKKAKEIAKPLYEHALSLLG